MSNQNTPREPLNKGQQYNNKPGQQQGGKQQPQKPQHGQQDGRHQGGKGDNQGF